MTDHELDSFTHQQQTQRLFEDFERMITAFNTSNITAATGGVSVREFLEVARVVSLLRAQYLQRVVSLASVDTLADLADDQLQKIRRDREAYEEALQGFGALRHALMRDYFKLNEDGDEINLTS
jgi:hypothetical protein